MLQYSVVTACYSVVSTILRNLPTQVGPNPHQQGGWMKIDITQVHSPIAAVVRCTPGGLGENYMCVVSGLQRQEAPVQFRLLSNHEALNEHNQGARTSIINHRPHIDHGATCWWACVRLRHRLPGNGRHLGNSSAGPG